MNYKQTISNLVEFIKNEVESRGFKRVVVGISGGLDSAVVASLCKMALPNDTYGILMPSKTSSKIHLNDAKLLCDTLDIKSSIYSLGLLQESFCKTLNKNITGIEMGNLCARLRMSILYNYAYSNEALVIGTSNKSEIMLGYGTIYGDLAYAINPIGDIYKTDIFKLAEFLNIPHSIIQKRPSADFYEGQSDEEELGFSYATIDEILTLLEQGIDNKTIESKMGKEALEFVCTRIESMKFKRQMPTIAKIN